MVGKAPHENVDHWNHPDLEQHTDKHVEILGCCWYDGSVYTGKHVQQMPGIPPQPFRELCARR